MKLSSVVVSAVLVLGACASSQSARSGDTPKGSGALGAPAAGLVKCEREADCDGNRICFDGYCRK